MTAAPVRLSTSDAVTIAGLAAGAVFGIAGTMVSQASLRQTFWGIDGVGLVVATGFLVFAISEGLLAAALLRLPGSGADLRRLDRHPRAAPVMATPPARQP